MSLSPNASASRPATPAPRPDLEALLLAAVRQRDRQGAARLVQQWVHRRGVGSLEHFQLEILAPREGTEAFDWLCQQIDDGPLAAALPVVSPSLVAPTPEPSEAAATIPRGRGGEARVDPAARAIAAVDAAFDALAAEFPQFRLPDPAARFVALEGPEGADPEDVHLEPTGAPERPMASPALISEAPGPELLRADIDLDEPPAVLEEPPADLFDDPILFPPATSDPLAGRRFSFEIPQPPAEPAPVPSAALEVAAASELPSASEATAEPAAEVVPAALSEAGASDAPLVRLRHRLRRGLSLTRVRTLMRDCLDEAVASLHPPQAEPLQAAMPVEAAEDFAFQDPTASGLAPEPLTTGFASVEPSLLPASVPATSPEPTAPAPAFAPRAKAVAHEVSQDVGQAAVAPLPPAAQLRERLTARRVETRPAPAPASLSDLRAWLPSVDDLPRAS